MGRYTKVVPKITKEEFIRTCPHYCNCPDKEIIEWKESFKKHGIPRYIHGHNNKMNRIFFPNTCKCGCGQEIPVKPYRLHRTYTPEYLQGHNLNIKRIVPKTTKEEFDKLQPRCHCPCDQTISWKEHYKWVGIPLYYPGHSSRTKNIIIITKEQFDATAPHYCQCGCNGIINWKEHYKQKGIPNVIIGHVINKQMYFLDICMCGCNNIVYGNKKYTKGHHGAKKYLYKIEFERTPKYCECGCNEIIQWYPHYAIEVNGKSLEARYLRGHYNKNKTFTDEHIHKISLSNTGKKKTTEQKEQMSKRMIGKFSGSSHPNWKGGLSYLPYCDKFNEPLKEAVRNRDSRLCQLCGLEETTRSHSVHHIHYDKENCYPDLITLCIGCNFKVNYNRDYYEKLFMNMLNDRKLLFWTIRILKK